jgi:hypothetical protein
LTPPKSIEQLITEVREKGRQREALADALLGGIADGDSLLFYRKDGQTALVGPDVSKAGGFRLTRFDRMGPVGHVEASSMREAVRLALSVASCCRTPGTWERLRHGQLMESMCRTSMTYEKGCPQLFVKCTRTAVRA